MLQELYSEWIPESLTDSCITWQASIMTLLEITTNQPQWPKQKVSKGFWSLTSKYEILPGPELDCALSLSIIMLKTCFHNLSHSIFVFENKARSTINFTSSHLNSSIQRWKSIVGFCRRLKGVRVSIMVFQLIMSFPRSAHNSPTPLYSFFDYDTGHLNCPILIVSLVLSWMLRGLYMNKSTTSFFLSSSDLFTSRRTLLFSITFDSSAGQNFNSSLIT